MVFLRITVIGTVFYNTFHRVCQILCEDKAPDVEVLVISPDILDMIFPCMIILTRQNRAIGNIWVLTHYDLFNGMAEIMIIRAITKL